MQTDLDYEKLQQFLLEVMTTLLGPKGLANVDASLGETTMAQCRAVDNAHLIRTALVQVALQT